MGLPTGFQLLLVDRLLSISFDHPRGRLWLLREGVYGPPNMLLVLVDCYSVLSAANCVRGKLHLSSRFPRTLMLLHWVFIHVLDYWKVTEGFLTCFRLLVSLCSVHRLSTMYDSYMKVINEPFRAGCVLDSCKNEVSEP